ncbi:hypothetical protein [Mangrovimonas spongiae]|uniref:Uncharacterized protein n=1 Tax=Mangrovimonas spongiae TaxID=2494697 RepID=A0A428K0M3_9FLAO|nr:hypothetical protein [Mangrovimonas spongiae]RSK39927.1 hypothetical protein EJA19_08575 [Mangrovimonas spongiae]
MAPLKFEEHIKERLESRHISPSQSAWNKLEDKLDVVEKHSNKKWYWIIGIAACFIGVLLLSTLFFKVANQSKSIEADSKVVEQAPKSLENTIETNAVKKTVKNEKLIENSASKEHIKVPDHKNRVVSNSNANKTEIQHEALLQKNVNQDDLVATTKVQENDVETTFEDEKIKEVVASIQKMKANQSSVTDTEIDSLLKKAQNDIRAHRIYNQATKTVDAMALLQDVEENIDHSFRDKVFEALLSSYETVKTAVAQRNH